MANHNTKFLINQILTNGFGYEQHYLNFKKPLPFAGMKLSPEQLATLRRFKEYYELKPSSKGGTIKPTSVLNTLQALRYLGFHLEKSYEQAATDDLIRYFRDLVERGLSEATLANYKVAVRTFYKWMHGITDPHTFPPVVNHVLLKPQRPKPSMRRTPDHFLTKEELTRMLESCATWRDKLLVMLTYGEGGLRAGEIVSINFGGVRLEERYCSIFIRESKSQERPVLLVDAFPYLREYLNTEYVLTRSPDSPLFYSHTTRVGQRLHRDSVTTTLKRVAQRAHITKNVFCHLGRHQALTTLDNAGLRIPLNAKRAGITIATLERVYLHHVHTDVDNAMLELRGVTSDADRARRAAERVALAPKACTRCGRLSPSTAVACQCGAFVDLRHAEEAQAQRIETDKLMLADLIDQRVAELAERLAASKMSTETLRRIKTR